MSAGVVLQAAIVARLRTVSGLGVFDAPPVRGGPPYAVVEEPMLAQADGVRVAGRTGTIAVSFRDAGERPVRLRRLIGAAEEAIAGLPAVLDEGWTIAGLRLARSRLGPAKGANADWIGMSEFAVRMYRLDA